jgi:hypothetical protein
LRTYTIDNKGKENILRFSPEDWWTGDMSGFLNGVPFYLLMPLEDSEVLLFNNASFQKLHEYIPASAATLSKGACRKVL